MEATQEKTHEHKEAFALMLYECERGCCHELIWNSRDGVTPFCAESRNGCEMTHVNWQNDIYAPEHKPAKGERYWVTATPELVRDKLNAYIDGFWDNPTFPMSKSFPDKKTAYDRLEQSWCQDGSPWLMEA